jgi:hypothetical protein
MFQRGRKTSANLVASNLNADRPHVVPPAHLSDRERRLFADVVTNCPVRQFVQTDPPLIASYVQATALAQAAVRKAASDPRALGVWTQAVRAQAMLARALRLTPQARIDPKVAGRIREPAPSQYDLMKAEREADEAD